MSKQIKSNEQLTKEWIEAWELHDDKPHHQAKWWTERIDALLTQKDAEVEAAVKKFQEIMQENKRETLFDTADANETADVAIENFVIAVNDDLAALTSQETK